MIVGSMLLGDLLLGAGLPRESLLRGEGAATVVRAITHDSRRIVEGSVFACVRGGTSDGHSFAADAAAAGAVALVVEREVAVALPQVVVPDSRLALGALSATLHGNPSRQLTVVGVTGTNGKTTTTAMIAAVLEAAGMPTGVIGTLTGRYTTPEAPDLQQQLAAFVAEGRRAVVMEVSSHALQLHRVTGTRFRLAVFTNLGRDHLDLHGTVERYFAAKAMLFDPVLSDAGIANVDDMHGRLLVDASPIPMVGFSLDDVSDIVVTPSSHEYMWCGRRVSVPIGGRFNVMNSLAAATAAESLGVSADDVVRGLAALPPVPGRFEAVRAGQPFDVIVDYAHTPDGLREALAACRAALSGGRVLVVFGCGGDRDREKRPEMGAVAAELADRVFVTSDNPRSERPDDIIDAILAGVPADYRHRVMADPDRSNAIAAALGAAAPGDVVLVAGKGHEATQTIGDAIIEFDDRAVVRALLGAAT